MKRIRRNGGARDLLAPKGIAILYSETDLALMHQLGLQFGFREFLSVQAKSDDHYRILKGQGPDAQGGAYDYLAQGRMIGGFAMVAWPVSYGNSGVMTFLVNHQGVVFEKDLGPDTAQAAAAINVFNPDKSWEKADMMP